MKDFMPGWNYKKHACTVTSFYLLVIIIGNCVMGTFKKLKKLSGKPISKKLKKLSKKEKLFNGILAGCYVIDMTLTFQIIKIFQKSKAKTK